MFNDPYLRISQDRANKEMEGTDKMTPDKISAIISIVLFKTEQIPDPLMSDAKKSFYWYYG